MLEAIKRAAGDPPVRKGAGYNGVYTAGRDKDDPGAEFLCALFVLCCAYFPCAPPFAAAAISVLFQPALIL